MPEFCCTFCGDRKHLTVYHSGLVCLIHVLVFISLGVVTMMLTPKAWILAAFAFTYAGFIAGGYNE
jgi:hypothetical protein